MSVIKPSKPEMNRKRGGGIGMAVMLNESNVEVPQVSPDPVE